MGQVISQDHLILQRQNWKGNGQSVVFVSGCFDLLHPGHVRLLEQARSYGDLLVVGVQSDASVRATNPDAGSNGSAAREPVRPITPGSERAEILAALAAVDYVVEYEELSRSALIDRLAPETVVQGATRSSSVAELDAPRSRASAPASPTIVQIQLEPGYSTEQLVERISQRPA